MSTGDTEYLDLHAALADTTPPCSNNPRFILDATAYDPGEVDDLRETICKTCPIRRPCRTYGDTARPRAGIWGGRTYPARKDHE